MDAEADCPENVLACRWGVAFSAKKDAFANIGGFLCYKRRSFG